MDMETGFNWMCQLRQLWVGLLFIWLVDWNLALTMSSIQWSWDVFQGGFSGNRNWDGVWGVIYFLRINPCEKKEKMNCAEGRAKNTALSHHILSQVSGGDLGRIPFWIFLHWTKIAGLYKPSPLCCRMWVASGRIWPWVKLVSATKVNLEGADSKRLSTDLFLNRQQFLLWRGISGTGGESGCHGLSTQDVRMSLALSTGSQCPR